MHMDSISMCSNTLYVSHGCRKWFEVVISINNDVMISFGLHK